MAKKIRAYEALAAHLGPDDPAEGERQIDAAILALQRARYLPRNLAYAMFCFGNALLVVGASILGARAACWLEAELWRSPMGSVASAMPVWAAVLLVVAAIGLHVMYWTFDREDYGRLPLPPGPIYEWLVAHGKSDLRYWHEMYWPHIKRLAHRKEILGFVFWCKTPRSVEQYPSVPALFQPPSARTDPHLIYLDSAEGRADRTAYLAIFEHRMDDCDRLSFMFTIALLAALLVIVLLPIFPPTPAGHLIRTGVLFAFIIVCVLIAFGVGFIRLRWLPVSVRRYWLRDLPPGAARFCDHMMALTD
ncbi:hypothetical protein [Sphingobium sp. D43FB]|uniref:hypothetical protein n=1 Tax=Sphingobium sp. D43FB TaxID=2017595 RepID=UPI000BB576B3|nr:hypothetical protein [Sphingobium sp. D43FB]PBN42936.1 hypothetical protein SxD43FB_13980 [Sphingobium sp. D43FB]